MSLVHISCAQCKEEFGLTVETHAQLKRSSADFRCPWGHSNYFPQGPSEAERLRQENARLADVIKREERWRREAEERAKRERHRANGYKGHATRITRRAKAGVCPCCNRTFQQLARHMASQHPDFAPLELKETIT